MLENSGTCSLLFLWTDLEILRLTALQTFVDSSCHGQVSLSISKCGKSKECGFPTFEFCTCLFLFLHLNLKAQTEYTLTLMKSKTVQDEHMIMWTSLLEGGRPKIITRRSTGIYDFFDNTLIKGWLPFILMKGGKNPLFKVSVPWEPFSCLEFKIILKFLFLKLWEHRKPISWIG